ncbi:MAG: helix-turn-helix domain-containing protein [Clostridia bacterium]|nr:helix-turn-helix domain-containing protein [Clostridia bacterium]
MPIPTNGTRQSFPPSPASPIRFSPGKVQRSDMALLRIPYWHEELEIKYYLDGRATVSCGGRLYEPNAGDLLVVNPCECHWTSAESTAVYHLMLIDLSHPTLRPLAGLCPGLFRFDGTQALENLIPGPECACKKLFLLLCEACADGGEYTAYRENLLRAFLCALIAEAQRGEPAAGDRGKALTPALKYIEHHYDKSVSVDELAAMCSLSPSRFSHLFREIVGRPAIRFLNEYRVSKAIGLMRSQDLRLSEVAAAVGFSDPAYFSRVFRAVVGAPPREYKK